MHTTTTDDTALVHAYRAGDRDALAVLVRRYLRPLYRFIYHYVGNAEDAEDITQATFVKMWRNIGKFDQHKSFKTWIFHIAKNTAVDFLRKKKAIPFSAFEDADGYNPITDAMQDPAPLPSEIFDRADIAQTVIVVLAHLSPDYRAVLSLRHHDHYTFREIAELLGTPLHTVKSRHRRAIIALKKLLAPNVDART